MSWAVVPVLNVGDILTASDWNAVADNMADSGWLVIANGSMTNSWINSTPVFGYRLIGNEMRMRGGITGGTSGNAAFTLPAGFRPPQTTTCPGAANGGPWNISITPGGVITPFIQTSGAATPVFFDSATFTID